MTKDEWMKQYARFISLGEYSLEYVLDAMFMDAHMADCPIDEDGKAECSRCEDDGGAT